MDGKIMVALLTMLIAGIGMVFSGVMMFSGRFEKPEIASIVSRIVPSTQTPTPIPTPLLIQTPTPPSITPSPPPIRYPIITYAPPIRYGNFQLLISDAQADITDFESLVVTFSHARVFKLGENGSEPGFRVLDLTSSKADLTQLIGEKALPILNIPLEVGSYSKIELYAENVEAKLVSNDTADVKIPSEKLQIIKPFEVKEDETTKFVFDINVVKKGHSNKYNLLPVISESGVVGKDIREDEVIEV